MHLSKFARLLAFGAVAALATLPVQAATKADPAVSGASDGTVTISAKAAALGVGYSWGDGVLVYHGHQYHFSVNGVSIADVGFAEITGHGRVYHLKKVQDFSGTYGALNGEATLVKGLGGEVLKNGNGVEIRIDEVTKGARLTGSADGVKLTLRP